MLASSAIGGWQWEEPHHARFLTRLASFSRLILFDKRGTGLSDPVRLDELPSLEQWMADVTAVIDAARADRVAVVAHGAGGPMAMLFAATYPERVSGLALISTFATLTRHDDYAAGIPPQIADLTLEWLTGGWGTGATLDALGPALPAIARYVRGSAGSNGSPRARASPRP